MGRVILDAALHQSGAIPQQHTSRIGSCIWSADGDDDDDNGFGHNDDRGDGHNDDGGDDDYDPPTAHITYRLLYLECW